MADSIDNWMPLWIADYLADTTRFNAAQHGAYLLLIMDSWRNGSPPDDDVVLAQIARTSLEQWQGMRPSIAAKFTIRDGVWRHKRVEAEQAEARVRREAASARAARAADARWNARADAQAMHEAMRGAVLEDMPEECSPPSPTPSPSPSTPPTPPPSPSPQPSVSGKGARTKRAPGRSIPADFAISDRVRAWAGRKGFGDLERYLEIFVGRNRASGKLYADWDEAFMNAVRDDWYELRKGGAANGQLSAVGQRTADNLRRFAAKRGGEDAPRG